MKRALIATLAIITATFAAQEVKIQTWYDFGRGGTGIDNNEHGGTYTYIPVTGMPFTGALRIDVPNPTPDAPHKQNVATFLDRDTVYENDSLVVTFYMRSAGSDSAHCRFEWQEEGGQWLISVSREVKAGSEWKKVDVGFRVKVPERLPFYTKWDARLAWVVGFRKQTMDLKLDKVINYSKVDGAVDSRYTVLTPVPHQIHTRPLHGAQGIYLLNGRHSAIIPMRGGMVIREGQRLMGLDVNQRP